MVAKKKPGKGQSIREYIADCPYSNLRNQTIEACRQHNIDLDSPWPPQFPEEQPTPPPADKSGQLLLFPHWAITRKAAPNAMFRCALFPAMSANKRKALQEQKLGSVDGVTTYFSGWQFDQSDLDVYLVLLDLMKDDPFGTEREIPAYTVLKALGRSTGANDYKWLHSVFIRLRGGTIDMTDHKTKYFGGLIDCGLRDEVTKHYKLAINPKFAVLFGYGMWASIDWQQRAGLGRNQTAKALHAYYSTHAAPAAHTFDTLAAIVGLTNSNQRQRNAQLLKAHEALKGTGFLSDYTATKTSIKVQIKHTPTQARHIVQKIAESKKQSRTKTRDSVDKDTG